MKTSNQVHHKGGKRRGFPQAQTQRSHKTKPRPVAFRFVNEDGQKAMRLVLDGDTFAIVQALAKHANQTLEEFFEQCCREKLERDLPTPLRAEANEGYGNRSGPAKNRAPDSLKKVAYGTHDSSDDLAQDKQGNLFLVHQASHVLRPITRSEALRWIIDNWIPSGFEQDFQRALLLMGDARADAQVGAPAQQTSGDKKTRLRTEEFECVSIRRSETAVEELPTLAEALMGDSLAAKVFRVAAAERLAIHDCLLFAMYRKLLELGIKIEENWVMEQLAAFRAILAKQRGAS